MRKINYAENRKKHLETYVRNLQLPGGGEWQRKGSYAHILQLKESSNYKINRENKYKIVCEKNILSGVQVDLFEEGNMHRYAHHLNSSQVLCYNFFRPLITKDKKPEDALIKLLQKQKIDISASATCSFEHCPNPEEGTQFDFHIKDDTIGIEVFFEIKYTEYGFGKAKKDGSHEEKFTKVYENYLKEQQCLKGDPTFEEFANHYQLYRNVIRITDKNKYVVLLYPKDNKKANSEANEFIEGKIKEEYKDNILCLYWEDIVEKNSELYRKYFAMTLLHLSDTHGLHRQIEDLPLADVIVHSGDFCEQGTVEEVEDFVEWFAALPHRHKIFVAGNHDDCLHGATIKGLPDGVHYLCNSGIEIDGVQFYGMPMFVADEVSGRYETDIAHIPTETDVLITHQPPYGILDFAEGVHYGSLPLLSQVLSAKPRFHLFGHVHKANGRTEAHDTLYQNGSIVSGMEIVYKPQLIHL